MSHEFGSVARACHDQQLKTARTCLIHHDRPTQAGTAARPGLPSSMPSAQKNHSEVHCDQQ